MPQAQAQQQYRLTQYSHGAGCGCKISPSILSEILQSQISMLSDERLLVGNETSDDAAVYALGNGQAVISTTDFFMPIVDDAFDFGRIAAANAISDIYAMGGKPLMAIAILGWPLEKLPPDLARQVLDGGKSICKEAGIPLCGGHSIDSPEPIFGLAVTGILDVRNLKQNSTATVGCKLYLTKPLGIGILTTAQKRGLLKPEHADIARNWMTHLNSAGETFGRLDSVKAMTDVTGFGLLGHLSEMCLGSGLSARIDFNAVPKIPEIEEYLALDAVPGGTDRNWASYGERISEISEQQRNVLCDPQTSGGLLVAVDPADEAEFLEAARTLGLELQPFGELLAPQDKTIMVS